MYSLKHKSPATRISSVPYLLLASVLVLSVGLSVAVKPLKPPKPPPSPKPTKPPPTPKPTKPPPTLKPSKSPKPPPPSSPPPSKLPYFNLTDPTYSFRLTRGIRTGSGGVAGRLELRPQGDGMFYLGYFENGGWAPLCDDYTLSEQEALAFCNSLGYHYGRQYYGEGISTFGAEEKTQPTPLGWLSCGERGPGDRDPVGFISIRQPSLFCLTYRTTCERKVLDALECSDTPLPAASSQPPRPPTPPPPPPPPPDVSPLIKKKYIEANLMPEGSYSRATRFELLVNTSNGVSVWAPLCASASDMEWYKNNTGTRDDYVANVTCHQANNWFTHMSYYLTARIGTPLLIPSGKPVEPEYGDPLFDPTVYTHWVTVVGHANISDPRKVQDMQLQVTTASCLSGYLFSANCIEAIP